MAKQMLRPAVSTNPDRPRPRRAEEQPDIARDASHADNPCQCYSSRGRLARARPHPTWTHDNQTVDLLEAASFVKPLAGGHSSGAPALPYGIGVSGVPNHAEHTTSQRALPKIPIDPSCANSPSAITSSIRPGATSKARQRANRPEKGKKAREVRTWRGRAEIALPPGS